MAREIGIKDGEGEGRQDWGMRKSDDFVFSDEKLLSFETS